MRHPTDSGSGRECLRALRRAMPEDEYYDDTNQYHNIVHEPDFVSYTPAYQTPPMMVSTIYDGCFQRRSPSSWSSPPGCKPDERKRQGSETSGRSSVADASITN